MRKGVDLEAAHKDVCAELNKTEAILPRLLKQKALTLEQMDIFRKKAKKMKAWAGACTEPMNLGAIHAFARMYWVHWYVRITGTNSLPLQTFLYLCEKKRLQTSDDISDGNDDQRLVGALLEDRRIAPYLLQDGRPKTVSQCIESLRNWCHLPTLDGSTLDDKHFDASKRDKAMNMVEKISSGRSIHLTYMYETIMNNNYRVTKRMYMDMLARMPMEERSNGLTDATLLRRYLIWEMDAPSCVALEASLFKAVQELPQWDELRVVALLRAISDKNKWQNAIAGVLQDALRTKLSAGYYHVSDMLQIALLKAALNVAGHQESLKAALVSTVKHNLGWQDSFVDSVLEFAMPQWREIFQTFKIEPLARSHNVISSACMGCLMPTKEKHKYMIETQDKVIGGLLENFMADARPILKEAYGIDHI